MSESLQREADRIAWRNRLMSIEGGPAWLLHVSRLYDHRERLLGPEHVGMPAELANRLHKRLSRDVE